jgi:hypothetical protein
MLIRFKRRLARAICLSLENQEPMMRNLILTLLLVSAVSLAGSAQSPGEFPGTGNNPFASPALGESIGPSRVVETDSELQSGPVGGSRNVSLVASSKLFLAASLLTSQQDPSQPTISSVQNAPNSTNQNGYVRPSAKARFHRYVKNVVGPMSLVRSAAGAAIGQADDSPTEWEQGASGYGKRFASQLGRSAIQETVSYGLQEALKVDGGFEKSKKTDFKGRAVDALLSNITARKPDGHRVLSIPRFAGVYTGSIVQATTWYPDRYSVRDGLRIGTVSLAIGFGMNLVREFILKR